MLCDASLSWAITDSDNGLPIIWPVVALLPYGRLETKVSKIWIKLQKIFVQKNKIENAVCKVATIFSASMVYNVLIHVCGNFHLNQHFCSVFAKVMGPFRYSFGKHVHSILVPSPLSAAYVRL